MLNFFFISLNLLVSPYKAFGTSFLKDKDKIEICELNHRRNERNETIRVECKSQEITISKSLKTTVYPISFKEDFDNKKNRVVEIIDLSNPDPVAVFYFDKDQNIKFEVKESQFPFFIEDLESKKDLTVCSGKNPIFLSGVLNVPEKLKIDAKDIFLMVSPVLNGSFYFKSETIQLEWFPFGYHSRLINKKIEIENVERVRTPSGRNISFKNLEKDSEKLKLEYLEKACSKITEKQLELEIPRYLQVHSDDQKYEKLSQWIDTQSLALNGEFGEALAQIIIQRKYPHFQFKDSKTGRHGFDAIFINSNSNDEIEEIYITEIKNTCNSPQLGTRFINHIYWQQLSTVYVYDVLQAMQRSEKKELADLILKNKDKVKLWLIQTCLKKKKMKIYDVGNFHHSAFD